MKLLSAILAFILFVVRLSAEIQSTTDLSCIREELFQCDDNTLFLIDIGGTMLVYKDPVLHVGHEEWKSKWFKDHCPNLTFEEKIPLIRAVEGNFNAWTLTDHWPALIDLAHHLNIKTVAFTKVLMDSSLENIRVDLLQRFGLNFKNELTELSHENELFIYVQGVIQTGQKLKGPVFKEIIAKLNKRPEKVLFVDDRMEQVQSMEEACQELGIVLQSFHYTAFKEPPLLNEEIAHKQLETLVREHKWLSQEDFR